MNTIIWAWWFRWLIDAVFAFGTVFVLSMVMLALARGRR